MVQKEILLNGKKFSYKTIGEGPVVMLVHGFGETGSIWKEQAEYLSGHCMLIIPDLPGSGESELPVMDRKNLSIEDLAESIHSIITSENIDECTLLGHSMGGYITLAFAEEYPDKLKAFGFIHSTAFADSEEKKQNRKKGVEMMDKYGSYAFLKTTTPNLFAEAFKKEHGDEVNKLMEEGRQFKKENLQQYYRAMMQRFDKTNVLKNSKVPVLFIMGTEDVAAPLNDVLKQVHQPEISYIHIVENTGHMSMLEMPGKLNELLKNFINETE